MSAADPIAILALAGRPQDLPLTPSARRRVRRVEIRLDLADPEEWPHRVREAERAFPASRLLATLRRRHDGGMWPDDADRQEALERILSIRGWDALDLESDAPDLEALLKRARRRAPELRLVLSRHVFEAIEGKELADQISRLRAEAQAKGAQAAKWAGAVMDLEEDGPELVRILSAWDGGTVPAVFPMGAGAEPWRVACAAVCGGWGYGHDGAGSLALGQLPWKVFDALLGAVPRSDRWDPEWFAGISSATALALREEVPT
ncbi:MAG TPA: type I 3-dehydroquinate dehydratase [Fibrobacteria bacterium]|nr:type I 3-dehydroquinate dehydratase [Fibrobacteria bacterium]